MASYQGEGNTETINLGWDSLSNIKGVVSKDVINNYFLNLSWTGANQPDNTTVKYFIFYNDLTFYTTNNFYNLPISYGESEKNPITGVFTTKEVCINFETRYYFNDGTYSLGETKSLCFCPPSDLYCKNKKTKSVNTTKTLIKNVSTKTRYSNAVKSSNGALGFNFRNCTKVRDWKKLDFKLAVGKNDCYKKTNVVLLPNQSV